MSVNSKEILNIDNLLQEGELLRRGNKPKNRAVTRAKGHIEERQIGKGKFYYYRRGIDKPVYLGTAEYILEKVRNRFTSKREKYSY